MKPHIIGDIVRLKRGWTPMVVLGVTDYGTVQAAYCHYEYNPVTKEYYHNPAYFSDYCRPQNGFVKWDGAPLKFKVYTPMILRYKTRPGHEFFAGELVSHTNNKTVVIRLDNNQGFKEFNVNDVVQDVPYTFAVKVPGSNHNTYRCHYTLAPGVSVEIGDALLSNSGNVYIVTAVNTNNHSPKAQFSGKRLITKEL